MKWASAKPSRPSPPAPCSTTSEERSACSSSPRPRSRPSGREQIRKFTTLSQQIVFGPRGARIKHYAAKNPPFFTLVNYEQVVTDTLDINTHLQPDIVVLYEAQRIKNWATKTARAVKRLQSRYAFVLTVTPIQNRIYELYSIVDFLDPSLLGPLFRFNPEFYQFNEKGRPEDYQNLPALREQRATATLGQSLVHCQEAMLPGDTTPPVLLTVLRDPTRAARRLAGEAPPTPPKPALTEEQLQRIADLPTFAAKKQKVARLLIEFDLPEESEPHQKAAERALAEADEVETA